MQIIVLGMHRSGTSAITRLIGLMGAYVGEPDALLETNADNAKGFWERKDVMHTNSQLLGAQQCNWQQVDGFDAHAAPPHPAIGQIITHMNQHNPWVMKDPRLCITLPCWLPQLTHPVAVIVSRHPLEIARSLELRNGMPIAQGLALWEAHAHGIIRHAADLPKIYVRYEEVLQNPVQATRHLCDALTEHIPTLCLPSKEAIEDFITPSMKRARKEEASIKLTAGQTRLYEELCGVAGS